VHDGSKKEFEEIKEKILEAYNSKDPKDLIKQKAERINQFIKDCNDKEVINNQLANDIGELEGDLDIYGLKLPIGWKISDLKSLLNIQKKKIDFRLSFRSWAGNDAIANDVIDDYFNKKLTAERAVNAHNLSISGKAINDEGQAKFAGKIYDLREKQELQRIQRDKDFVSIFHNLCDQQNVLARPTDAEILSYCKASPNGNFLITAEQAFNAYHQQG